MAQKRITLTDKELEALSDAEDFIHTAIDGTVEEQFLFYTDVQKTLNKLWLRARRRANQPTEGK